MCLLERFFTSYVYILRVPLALFLDACSITLLTSPTEDLGKLLASLHGLRPGGTSNLVGAIKTAMVSVYVPYQVRLVPMHVYLYLFLSTVFVV